VSIHILRDAFSVHVRAEQIISHAMKYRKPEVTPLIE
jgi:hypothetical protein